MRDNNDKSNNSEIMYELKWSDRSNIRDISESNIIDNNYKSDSSDIIHRGDSRELHHCWQLVHIYSV